MINVQHQNTQISTDLAAVAAKFDYQSRTLVTHDQEISRITAEQSDLQYAFSDRNPTSEIVVSSIPKDLTLTSDELAQGLFTFFGLPKKFYGVYLSSTRFANIKRQNATTNSLIFRMTSSEMCGDVLHSASQKRRVEKFTIKNIFGIDDDAIIYVNKMQPAYIHDLDYLTRQAEKRFGWRSVWTHAGNVCIKKTDQAPYITISLISQLEAISKWQCERAPVISDDTSLSMGYCNADDLRANFSRVKQFIIENKLNVTAVAESWLNDSINIHLSNYTLLKNDWGLVNMDTGWDT